MPTNGRRECVIIISAQKAHATKPRDSPSTEIPERRRKIRKSIAHKVKKTQYKFDVIHVERMLKVWRIDQDVRERMSSLQKECYRRSCQIGRKLDALADRMVKFHSIKVNSIEDLDAIDYVNRADYSKHIANRGQRWNVKVLLKTPEDLKTEDDDLETEDRDLLAGGSDLETEMLEEVKQAIERVSRVGSQGITSWTGITSWITVMFWRWWRQSSGYLLL